MAEINLVHVYKYFYPSFSFKNFFRKKGALLGPREPHFALTDVNLTIPDARTTVVLGPTGCGKSTLLRIIGGLLPPDQGKVLFDGKDITELPPGERRIGMVFQDYALYPHLTVKTNILSYFFFKKWTKQWSDEMEMEAEEKYRRTSQLLGVKLEHLSGRFPPNLSSGEKQRVAIGRCITRDPSLFLMDEPFSHLDQPLREEYRRQLKALLSYFDVTTVYVTHDQHEALLLADRLVVMREGKIEQAGTPEEIYQAPRNLFVAEFFHPHPFLPAINLIPGDLMGPEYREKVIGIRPEDFSLRSPRVAGDYILPAQVVSVFKSPLAMEAAMRLKVKDRVFVEVPVPSGTSPSEGDEVGLVPSRMHIFDPLTGERTATHHLQVHL
ncbi:ABC transporter related protein [Spirochaeta thermophila DSM 6578]|uniref:ABC transporter related protein n=1 Tax=Winmispira thermophila (strain ATCC 700085 / DSM 6578 / Z-1203) TaxID=869211 RepID=G0GET8_WINT7|nr:ABC transporter ATP-binding protein [Spirochaeta thermophila]AEJ61494.1 ABC transporter related protein [Spirochaeta thermophila DSM 6578]